MTSALYEGPALSDGHQYADTVAFLHDVKDRATHLAEVSPKLAEAYADKFYKVEFVPEQPE